MQAIASSKEALKLAQLTHPNIIKFRDFGGEELTILDANGRRYSYVYPFIITDYANAGNVRALMSRNRDQLLPIETALHITSHTGDAIQYAHDKDILHRDVKPENILLNKNKKHTQAEHYDIFVADFGFAIAAHASSAREIQDTRGTFAYMAPEQFLGQAVQASDQYALGIIAYELLTGSRPFSLEGKEITNNAEGIVWGLLHARGVPPTFAATLKKFGCEGLLDPVQQALEEPVMKALEKTTESRYASVEQFTQTLKETKDRASAQRVYPHTTFSLPLD